MDTDTELRTDDGRDVLRFQRFLPHPPQKVWRAVTEPGHLAEWFPAKMNMRLAVGEQITFGAFGGTDGGDGVITEVEEPRVFAFTWNGEALRIELTPAGDGCELVFTHAFDNGNRTRAGSFAAGWNACLDAMASVVDGTPVQQMTEERYIADHERLHAQFGLLHGTAEHGAGRWTLRVERLFPQHKGVWAALTDGAEPTVGQAPPIRFTNGYVPAGAVTEAAGDGADGGDGGEHALAYGSGGGEVRWSAEVVPQGTLVIVTQTLTGDDPAARATALAAWHTQMEVFAAHLRGTEVCPWPADRTEELRRAYAAG
ncbi:MAG TPA: SRPBCC family protein [Streptosporangiaceae bacterium]|jgi:uncharacterized protein YndB with AHSA1/START domain